MPEKITENLNSSSQNSETKTNAQTTDSAKGNVKQKTGAMVSKAKQARSEYKAKMAQYPPQRKRQKQFLSFSHAVMIIIGNFLVAFGFRGFVAANDFFSAGAFGLAGILNHFLPVISFSLAVLIFSIPMLIVGWFNVDKKFAVFTAFSIIMQVVLLEVFDNLVIYNNDPLLAAIFGGVMMGTGDGLVLRGGSGTSAIHLVAMALKKKLGLSVSNITVSINLLIVFCATMIFGLEKGLYTLILIFVAGRVMELVLDGMSRKRTAFIVTAKGQEIGDRLMEFLNRGVTMMPGTGLYSGYKTDVLFCVVNVLEVAKLKNIVRDVDPHAFVTVYETAEVAGHFSKNSLLFDKRSDE
ncbi:MAG: YitT family protein [Bacillota bacterium]|jgi:uncharacterized membrane-anchored protein YitT (DUF2179 family)